MMTTRPLRARPLLLMLLVGLAFPAEAAAEVKYPPLPETVQVEFRYRIRAPRDERVRQFRLMQAHLDKLGFNRKRQPGDETDIIDPTAERMAGTIPSKNVFALLDDPRIQTVLFRPTNSNPPDDPLQPVSLRIHIATGYLPADQHRLHRQVVERLQQMGFREAIGYDHHGYTLVRGDLPISNAFRLLKDLRQEPAGWFVPETPASELPLPIRETLPIRAVEVMPDPALNPLQPQPIPPNRLKFTPGLRAVMEDPARLTQPIRIEAVMDEHLDSTELEEIRGRLRTGYSRPVTDPGSGLTEIVFATLEGGAGNVITIQFPQAGDVERFAAEPGVVLLRLPRPTVETADPTTATLTPAAKVLEATRLDAFHQKGYRGQGTKIAIIATEFPGVGGTAGAEKLAKDLASPVAFIDLTAEYSRELLPAPATTGRLSPGMTAARAAHLAAPGAALVLVRVDPASLHQVLSVARFVRGDREFTEAMQSRIAELTIRTERTAEQRTAAAAEYRRAFQNLSDEEAPRLRRERARKAFDAIIAEERTLAAAIRRANDLQAAMRELEGCDVVVNTLVWETGYALDGLSELSRVIDQSFASKALASPRTRSATRPQPAPRPLWVQASSPSIGSVWAGSYLDADDNGTMEFATTSVPMPKDEWTRELNFLATRGADGKVATTLPAGAKVRLTVQWRETHDPNGYGGRESVFPLTLRVFQQLDPEGKTRASDELQEVARSVGGPYEVQVEPTYGVYEQLVEFTVPAEGRYCVMMEGQEIFDPRLPALRRHIEIRPRLFAAFLGNAPVGARPVFASYAPREAGVGIPGDAPASITVGATDEPLGTIPTGLTGGGPGVELLVKPTLLADGSIDVGPGSLSGQGPAAGFAGGVLAAMVGSGAQPTVIIESTGLKLGGPVEIPPGWLQVVPPR